MTAVGLDAGGLGQVGAKLMQNPAAGVRGNVSRRAAGPIIALGRSLQAAEDIGRVLMSVVGGRGDAGGAAGRSAETLTETLVQSGEVEEAVSTAVPTGAVTLLRSPLLPRTRFVIPGSGMLAEATAAVASTLLNATPPALAGTVSGTPAPAAGVVADIPIGTAAAVQAVSTTTQTVFIRAPIVITPALQAAARPAPNVS